MQKDENEKYKQLADKFLQIDSNKDLAEVLEISLQTLIYYAYRLPKTSQYSQFTIPKRSGKNRTITAPSSNIKIIQRNLNRLIQTSYSNHESKYSYAFSNHKSNIKNAKVHKSSKLILNIDLKDFFDQIHFGRIKGAFMHYPFNFNKDVSNTLANLVTYDSKLPQGAPTSPILSNIVCWSFDKEMSIWAQKYKFRYTRYADDITISTIKEGFPEEILVIVEGECYLGSVLLGLFQKHKFAVNYEKVKFIGMDNRQLVTGVVVNEKLNVKRAYIRQIRKELFIWSKYGSEGLVQKFRPTYKKPTKIPTDYTESILGKLNYIRNVRGQEDELINKYFKWFWCLRYRDIYLRYSSSDKYQDRGYFLEELFNFIFKVNSIDVREKFTRDSGADQIDGAFVAGGKYFLVECKWHKDTEEINKEIDAFKNKIIDRSGDDAKGFFVSISGWNKVSFKKFEQAKVRNCLFLNGEDIENLLANYKLNLDDFLNWKIKQLEWENKPFASVEDYVLEKNV